jgi:multiple sugar transport system ATP-binding protein
MSGRSGSRRTAAASANRRQIRTDGRTVGEGVARTEATIELIQPTGSRSYATFRLGGEPVMAELQAHDVSRPGEKIAIDINLRRASLFDARSERAI